MRGLLLTLCLLPAMSWAAAGAPGGALYRYVDSRGVTVLDRQGVPPEYIGKGYQVLNQQGRVIQTVPPAPTAEELRQRQAAQARADADARLVSDYPSVAELDRARARKLAELDGLIALARNQIEALRVQQGSVQSQAADLERAGREVSPGILAQLQDVRNQRAATLQRVADLQRQRGVADQEFAALRVRLSELLGGEANGT